MNSTAHSLFLKKSYPSQTNHSHGLWNAGDGDNEEPQQAAAYAASPSPEMEGAKAPSCPVTPEKVTPPAVSRNKGWIWVSGGARNISVHGANQFRAQHCGDRLNSQPSQCLTLQWIRMPQLSVFSLMVVATKPPISPWCPGWFLCVSSSNFVIRKVLEIQNNFSNISNSNTRQWFQTLTRLTETTQ